MTEKIQFEAQIAKFRRINIPKPLFQFKDGDKVIVTLEKITDNTQTSNDVSDMST